MISLKKLIKEDNPLERELKAQKKLDSEKKIIDLFMKKNKLTQIDLDNAINDDKKRAEFEKKYAEFRKKFIKEEIDINKLRNHADVTIAGIHEQPGYIIMDLLNPATRQKALKNLLSRGYHVNKIDGIKTNYGLKIEK